MLKIEDEEHDDHDIMRGKIPSGWSDDEDVYDPSIPQRPGKYGAPCVLPSAPVWILRTHIMLKIVRIRLRGLL